MDLAQNGELSCYIKKYAPIDIEQARFITAELLNSLCYLTSEGIVHWDLKADNILFDDHMHCRLVDFGAAKYLKDEGQEDLQGTLQYISPEMIRREKTTPACDLWALGVLLYRLMTDEFPFTGETEEEIFQKIQESEPAYPKSLEKDAKSLIQALLKKDASDRFGQ